jgi:nucleoside-diphosphate-sugar epimerase
MTVAITGGTGLVGSYLAYRLTREGRNLVLIGRGPDFEYRAKKRITVWGPVEDWDLVRFRGWNPTSAIDGVSRLIHAAADTNLSPKSARGQVEANLELLDRALVLCDRWKIPRLDFISTAYVCGNRVGNIPEERHLSPGGFRNPYEKSKWLCEEKVFDLECRFPQTRFIHRPSLILPPLSQATGNTPRAFARLFEKLRFLSHRNRGGNLSVSIPSTARIGFVPLTAFAEDFLNILDRGPLGGPSIFHYTSRETPAIQTWTAWLSDWIPNLKIDLRETCPLGKRILGELEPYIEGDFSFSHSNLEKALGGRALSPLAIAEDYFRGLLDCLVETNTSRSSRRQEAHG